MPPESLESGIYWKLMHTFNFNLEANLPTYFSSLVLMGNAGLLFLIGRCWKREGKKYWKWMGLAVIFFILSIDEMIKIHDHFRSPMEKFLGTSGILYYAWIIPYGIVTVILGVVYFKFFMALPKRILSLFVLSAILFISGAIGLEAIGGMYDEQYGQDNITYYILYTVEELLEMFGSIIFLYSLIMYLNIEYPHLKIKFGKNELEANS
ncbi:peptidase M48 Ste24p [Winogradskyella ursingii]|uniref:peptidase M48 Ste24p n=1 Tax=Winogradskyella ursingii TaxID=2686079 RepID=UPI0015C6D90F|nr:peptidase M48 Ste24p [Winogradskyella ursingii]